MKIVRAVFFLCFGIFSACEMPSDWKSKRALNSVINEWNNFSRFFYEQRGGENLRSKSLTKNFYEELNKRLQRIRKHTDALAVYSDLENARKELDSLIFLSGDYFNVRQEIIFAGADYVGEQSHLSEFHAKYLEYQDDSTMEKGFVEKYYLNSLDSYMKLTELRKHCVETDSMLASEAEKILLIQIKINRLLKENFKADTLNIYSYLTNGYPKRILASISEIISQDVSYLQPLEMKDE